MVTRYCGDALIHVSGPNKRNQYLVEVEGGNKCTADWLPAPPLEGDALIEHLARCGLVMAMEAHDEIADAAAPGILVRKYTISKERPPRT